MSDLERMAREAGFDINPSALTGEPFIDARYIRRDVFLMLARFADLIRADERERCAKVCDARAADSWGCTEEESCSLALAEAIRGAIEPATSKENT